MPKFEIKQFIVTCDDCGHEWEDNDPDEDTFCPNCGSYNWELEY